MAQALQLRRRDSSELSRSACPDCLRRSLAAGPPGPYIERIATGAPGSRSPELLRLSNEDLAAAAAPKVAAQILAQVEALPERRLRERAGARRSAGPAAATTTLYPAGLRDAADAPWALIGRGDPACSTRLEPDGAVTVVGARRATSYGREVARELGRELAAAGMVVVSGLAFGIDACAHRGALDGRPHGRRARLRRRRRLPGGAPLALAADLRARAWCSRSCRPGRGAWRWTFPARNRIMAALAGMTVVVEAARALRLADHRRPRRRPGPRPRRRPRPGHLARLGRPQRPARRRRLPRPRRPGRARRDARARACSGSSAAGPPLEPELARGPGRGRARARTPATRSPPRSTSPAPRRPPPSPASSCSATSPARCVGVYSRDAAGVADRIVPSRLRGRDDSQTASPQCSRSPARTPAAAPASRPT